MVSRDLRVMSPPDCGQCLESRRVRTRRNECRVNPVFDMDRVSANRVPPLATGKTR